MINLQFLRRMILWKSASVFYDLKTELGYILKTLFSLCLIGLIVTPLLPLASAHGVCTGILPRFGRLDDVHFSSQSVQTGDTIIITGNITTMVQQDLQGYLSIHSSPSPHARWIVVSTEPSEKMINVTQFSRVPFSMTIKALQPGTYKLSPMLYLPEIGPAFGMLNGCNTEPVVTVTGKSICNTGFVSILKAEDGSSFCVKSDTAQKLIERSWAKNIDITNQSSSQIQNPRQQTQDNLILNNSSLNSSFHDQKLVNIAKNLLQIREILQKYSDATVTVSSKSNNSTYENMPLDTKNIVEYTVTRVLHPQEETRQLNFLVYFDHNDKIIQTDVSCGGHVGTASPNPSQYMMDLCFSIIPP